MSSLNLEQVNRGDHQLGMALCICAQFASTGMLCGQSKFAMGYWRGEGKKKNQNHDLFEVSSSVIDLRIYLGGQKD